MHRIKRSRVTPSTTSTASSSTNSTSLLFIKSPEKGLVIRWTVNLKQWLARGTRMGSYQVDAQNGVNEIVSLIAPHDGRIEKFLINENVEVNEKDVDLCLFYYCEHPVLMDGMCGQCGNSPSHASKEVETKGSQTVNVSGGYSLVINRDEQLVNHDAVTRRLFSKKKLSLVLDLDHTLLHCTDDPRGKRFAERKKANVLIFELGDKQLVLKTRPGLEKFLRAMDEKFEIYIYTAATRAYARLVCDYIDPKGKYFGERIVARTDTPELGVEKSLERLFPVDSSMVIIVDDRDVWSGSPNLLTCEPFHFFHGMHEVNNESWHASTGNETPSTTTTTPSTAGSENTSTPPLNNNSDDASTNPDSVMDPGLTRVKSILDEVWRSFFYPVETRYSDDGSPPPWRSSDVEAQLRGEGADVKAILASIHARVLNGTSIAFDPKTPRVDWLYQRAKVCGAVCVNEVTRRLTHLVAGGDTSLARIARDKGVFVVKPTWLELSDHYWSKQKEESFAVFASGVVSTVGGAGLLGSPTPPPPSISSLGRDGEEASSSEKNESKNQDVDGEEEILESVEDEEEERNVDDDDLDVENMRDTSMMIEDDLLDIVRDEDDDDGL